MICPDVAITVLREVKVRSDVKGILLAEAA
jgi:hypothetical protein